MLLSMIARFGSVEADTHEHGGDTGQSQSEKSFNPNRVATTQEIINPNVQGIPNDFYEKKLYGKGIKIAILDTGIDVSSDQFSIVSGYNFVGNNKDFKDDNGHGTKIAGIINAKRDGVGMAGIAPESLLYIGKVANNNGKTNYDWLISGVEWAIKEKVEIINISLEFPKGDKKLEKVIKKAAQKNIIILASGGNIKFEGDTNKVFPASYSEVLSVGMLNVEGSIYSKEFDKKNIDVFFPGEDITATYFKEKLTLDTGVSFATAYGSGVVALMMEDRKETNRPYTSEELKKEINSKIHSKSKLQIFIQKMSIPLIFIAVFLVLFAIWYKKYIQGKSLESEWS